MIAGFASHVSVLLSGLVRLPIKAAGQVRGALLLGCPTVQPSRRHAHT